MIKTLSCPDLHSNPKWLDVMKTIYGSIEQAAAGCDFVAYPGDLWDKVPLASDDGGLTAAIRHIENIHCPKVAVYGTESHDAKGSYRALEKAGLTILRPGKVYGLFEHEVRELSVKTPYAGTDLKAVLFGVPEPRKSSYMAKLKGEKTAEEINKDLTDSVHKLITDFIAPARVIYGHVPAFGLLHGNVSDAMDKAAEDDVIFKASDIITRTDVMSEANLDAWFLGHIHTPWQSSKITAFYSGFAGIDRNPWGKRNFVPAMTQATYTGPGNVELERISYGAPMRVKIYKPLQSYDPNIAYWLVTDDLSITKVEGGHEWSRVTRPEEKRIAERRISAEQLEESETLIDIANLYEPGMPDSKKEKIQQIRQAIPEPIIEEKILRFKKIRVQGCTFYKGKTLEADLATLPNGQICITGDNGSGKSSLFSWAHWWPVCIGKDTLSGRQSAIKDFFDAKGSQIYKEGYKNGVKHTHIIDIKGAHTQSPRVICSLMIEDKQILEAADWETMMAKCTELYGSLDDYIKTAMYVQPQQSDKYSSGLMNATMTDIRDIVQNITGIDYEAERKYAYGQAAQLRESVKQRDIELNALAEVLPVIEDLEEQVQGETVGIRTYKGSLLEAKVFVNNAEETLKTKQDKIAVMEARKAEHDKIKAQLSEIEKKIGAYNAEAEKLDDAIFSIAEHEAVLSQDDEVKAEYDAALKAYEAAQARNEKLREKKALLEDKKRAIESEIAKGETEHRENWHKKIEAIRISNEAINKKIAAKQAALKDIESIKEQAKQQHRTLVEQYRNRLGEILSAKEYNQQIDQRMGALRVPCEKCGHIQSDAQKKIDELETSKKAVPDPLDKPIYVDPEIPAYILADAEAETGDTQTIPEIHAYIPPEETTAYLDEVNLEVDRLQAPEKIELPGNGLSSAERSVIQNKISALKNDLARAKTIREEIVPQLVSQGKELEEKLEGFHIKEISDEQEKFELEAARNKVRRIEELITQSETAISQLKKTIEDTKKKQIEIKTERDSFAGVKDDADEWEEIYKMLTPSKLPAFQLEGYLTMIDDVATDVLNPWREGRYIFQTETQIEGKKGIVDRFASFVIDSEDGRKALFTQHSPGEKGMLNDALVKALRKVREMRMKTDYTPVILDEADGPINEDNLQAYMEMQRNFYGEDRQILTVTHKAAYQELIGNKYHIKEFLR